MTETLCERRSCMKNNGKSPTFNSFLERRDSRRKLSESLRAGASLAPCLCQRISLGSVNDWKGSSFASATTDRCTRLDSPSIATSGQDRARTGRSGHATNLRSHFVIRPCRALERLRARFFWVVFLANEGELAGKTFTTSLNTTNPNTLCEIHFSPNFPFKNMTFLPVDFSLPKPKPKKKIKMTCSHLQSLLHTQKKMRLTLV